MTYAHELNQIAIEFAYRYPDTAAKLARLARDVQRMETILNGIVADAQDEADGAEYVAALNRAKDAGVLVELRPRNPPVFVGFAR